MSQAKPMDVIKRREAYDRHNRLTGRSRRLGPTHAQERQSRRMVYRSGFFDPEYQHGATGVPVRKPRLRPRFDLRGSIRTHFAVYCLPCSAHSKPLLHRQPHPSF